MARIRFSWLLVGMLALVTACVDETVPTGTAGQSANAQAPAITDIEASEIGKGLLRLQVRATDPAGGLLSFTWRVDKGSLSANSGQTVIWTLPSEAGTYAVTVEGENTAKARSTATRRVQVAADGTATSSGQVETTTGSGNTPTVGNGQFQIATPVPVGAASVLIVGSNPSAAPLPQATPSPPFQQPVATPAPGASGTPGVPVGQPIATPTPTVPPATPTPQPTPTPRPATPEPGVPQQPDARWVKYDASKVPTRQTLNKVHFPTETRGYAVGASGIVIKYNQTAPNTSPAWTIANSGVPAESNLTQVFFASPDVGFIAGNGLVMRTLDGGATWQNITPPGHVNVTTALVVYNAQIVVVASQFGQVFRTESANASTAGNVTWRTIDTRPPDRPDDNVSIINAGAGFAPTDTTQTFFVGDAIYRFDSDASAASQWKRIFQFDDADGQGATMDMDSINEIWVGTSKGRILKSSNSGNAWSRISTYVNREFNGNNRTHGVSSWIDMNICDTNNVFGLMPDILDTTDAGASWRRTTLPGGFVLRDMQIDDRQGALGREFFGWGVGIDGVYQYIPADP